MFFINFIINDTFSLNIPKLPEQNAAERLLLSLAETMIYKEKPLFDIYLLGGTGFCNHHRKRKQFLWLGHSSFSEMFSILSNSSLLPEKNANVRLLLRLKSVKEAFLRHSFALK